MHWIYFFALGLAMGFFVVPVILGAIGANDVSPAGGDV